MSAERQIRRSTAATTTRAKRCRMSLRTAALLVGPVRFTPQFGEPAGYNFAGTIALDRVFSDVEGFATLMASPAGVEPASPP
jgi:hypothetical protein